MVYVAIGVAYPTFLYSSVVAAVYLVLAVWALPEAIRRLRARRQMSWATHDLEPYVIQRKLGLAVAIVPLLVGSYSPDIFTKWFVYGFDFLGIHAQATDPESFHRSWPGVGFTHSLAFGALVAGIIYLVTRSKVWALSFMIGNWAHVISDIGDTLGVMLFFPFSTHHVALGAWAYAGQYGRLTDAAAYFSGLGFVWDGFWVLCALLSWRVVTARLLPPRDRPRRPARHRPAGQALARGPRARALSGDVLLRDRALGRLAGLGPRLQRLPLRPLVGRAALRRRGEALIARLPARPRGQRLVGVSDFIGGLQSRRFSALSVLIVSQPIGLVLAYRVALAFADDTLTAGQFARGAARRRDGRARSRRLLPRDGPGLGQRRGDRRRARADRAGHRRDRAGEAPHGLQAIGAVIAISAVVLVAREPDPEWREASRESVGLAALAALGFGTFFLRSTASRTTTPHGRSPPRAPAA